MSFFNEYPYMNENDLNLDYMLARMRNLERIVATFVSVESVTFADPITWNITTQYAKNTVVLDNDGNAYLSKQAVPQNILLTNSDYWLEIFNFMDYVRSFDSNLTLHSERNVERATNAYSVDDWLLYNDILYKVTAAIAVNDLLVIGTNLERFTVEEFCRAWKTYLVNLVEQYKRDIDASELQYKNDIDLSESQYRAQLAQDIADTTATLSAQLAAAISGVTVDSEVIDARVGADGVTYNTLGDAIRTQFDNSYDLIRAYNVDNLIEYEELSEQTINTVKCTPTNHSIKMKSSSTTTANQYYNLYNAANIADTPFTAGKTYKWFVKGVDNSRVQIVSFDADNVSTVIFGVDEDGFGEVTIPNDCAKITIRLRIFTSTDYDEEITFILSDSLPNLALTQLSETLATKEEVATAQIIEQLKTSQMFGNIPIGARGYFDVAIDEDGFAYVTVLVGAWNSGNQTWSKYNGTYNGLCKFDVSNPLNPILVAHNRLFDYDDAEQDGYNPTRLAVKNGYVYVACRDAGAGRDRINTSSDDTNGYLFILDCATLTIQRTIKYHGTVNDDWWGKACGVSLFADEDNSYLAVSLQKAGYILYDLTNRPTNPYQIYQYTPAHEDTSFEVQSGNFFTIEGQTSSVYFALCGFTDGIRFLRIVRANNDVALLSTFVMPVEALGGHSFDCRVKYPYCYASLAPKRADIEDTSVPRAGIMIIDITTVSSPILHSISWIPKDENTLNTSSDTMPTHLEFDEINNFMYVNNGERGFAAFKVNSDGIPEYKGCLKRDEDETHAIISDGYRLYATGTRNYDVFATRSYLTPSAFRIYNAIT